MRDKPSTSRRSGRPPTPALPVDTRRSTATQDNEWQNEAHANHAPYGLICASYFTLFWVAKSIYSDIFFLSFLFPVPRSISFYFLETWKEEGKTMFGIAVSFPRPMIVLLTHQAAYSLPR